MHPISLPFSALSVRKRLEIRHTLVGALRSFFAERGFLEVHTQALCACPGIDPYVDALRVEGGLYLATSPELRMKRLMAAGAERIFQIGKAFRAGEKGELHNLEFTILEWYTAGQDYRDMMADTEALVMHAAAALAGKGRATPASDWPRPFHRLTVDEAFRAHAGWAPSEDFDADRFFLDLVEKVEGPLGKMGAVFLHDFPAELGSLARTSPENPRVAERFELYLEGLEICNGFSELGDRLEQEERFRRANEKRLALGKEAYAVDGEFLEALETGFPACAGNALGVERLLMSLTGSRRIGDVLF